MLAIRDADETQALGSPTSISGTVDEDTGIISGATLSTPPLEFDTIASGLPVKVKATFAQVTPAGGTGSVNGDGKVVLRDTVRVTLDLNINGGVWIQKCITPPVQLELLSTDVYSQEDGGTIVDPDFTIPTVPPSSTCDPIVAGGVNDLLEGSGHSLSLFIKGDLPLPDPGEPTTTTLSASPSGSSLQGVPVTLVAAVAATQANALDPTGVVVFKDGARILGNADLAPDGTAALTTRALRSGTRALTAVYQGDADFAGSTSPTLPYTVAPTPIITGTFPEYIRRGAPPIEFDLTVDNTTSPRPVANGRVDIVIPTMNPGSIVLERQLPDSSWVALPMPYSAADAGVAGSLGPEAGVLVPAGGVQTHRMRVSATSTAKVQAWAIQFALVTVDPVSGEEGETVATSRWPFNLIAADRLATTTTFPQYDGTLRPGQTYYIEAYVTPTTGGPIDMTGEIELLLDGKVVPSRIDPPTIAPLAPMRNRQPVAESGQALAKIILPADLTTGSHVVTVRYVGDASFRPSTFSRVLSVVDPLGPLYTCDMVSIYSDRYGAYIETYVRLPAHAEDGEELDLEDLEITLVPGGIITTSLLRELTTTTSGTTHIEIDLGEAGAITGDSVAYTENFDPLVDPSIPSDQRIRLQGLEGTIVVDGEPGEVVPLPVESIVLTGTESFVGANFTFTCRPQAEAVVLEEVGVAGVSLDVATTTDPVRVGDAVVLTAVAAPADPYSLVEFFAGSESLGTAPGASGTATLTVDDLPEGTNFLMARYTGVPGSPYQSEVVELEVLPGVECASFAESGHGATVRLVYLELLGRCPDQGGFDYWKGRLAGGTSASVFARAIAGTSEAVGRVVDDAYQTMLGRAPDGAGRAFWIKRLQANGRYDSLLADLGASGEFWAKSGSTNSGFVTRVYDRLLGRVPDADGLGYWVDRLRGGTSRRALVLSLANQSEPLGRLVAASYDEILGRAPSTSERTDGMAFLRSSGDRSGLYAELIGLSEFSTRAQGFPNPED